jgi:hypothetical protein
MIEGDYESLGDMIKQSDCWITEEVLTKKEILHKYKDRLTEQQIELLTKTNYT